jgi:uncharacterized membrane protein
MGSFLLVLHLLGAVLWVGGMAFALLALRPALAALEPPQRLALMGRVHRRFFLLVWHAMPIVIVSGYLLLFWVFGGFGGVRWQIHLMHLLGLIMAGVFVLIFFKPWARMRRALEAGDLATAATTNEEIRKLVLLNLVLGTVTVALGAWGRL